MTSVIGVIGGSGFYSLDGEEEPQGKEFNTPYSDLPVFLHRTDLAGKTVWFLPRHGMDHSVPPHLINYRANLWALKEAGATAVIAVNVVGGITPEMSPGSLVIPDQIIDYTWGREHTFVGGLSHMDNHVDFTWPYDENIAGALERSATSNNMQVKRGGVYACTQGPRLESAAEIRKLKKDGCDIVGMTGMPEAGLARELALPYASIALVVNWGAGLADEKISFSVIESVLAEGVADVRKIVCTAIGML